MGRTKKILLVIGILGIGLVLLQMRSPFSESLQDWLAKNQSLPADQVPRTESGRVDFLKMTNDRLSKNVTVENNILVDLYQITPESSKIAGVNQKFIDLLGNPKRDVEQLTSFITKKQFPGVDTDEQMYDWSDNFNHCITTPWQSGEFPEFKNWLEVNQGPIDQMVAASHKPYYYHPLVGDPEGKEFPPMIGVLLEHSQRMRSVARMLSARAMNHLAEDRIEDCLTDLAAVRRLGFKMQQASTLVEQLISIAIINIGFDKESLVLSSGKLNAEQCTEYQKVISETTTSGTLGECIRHGERIMMMDTLQWMASGNNSQDMAALTGESGATAPFMTSWVSPFVDWRETAEKCSEFYDRLIEVASIEDDVQRQTASVEFEEMARQTESQSIGTMIVRLLAGARSRGRVMSENLTQMLAPAILQCDAAYIRSKMHGIAMIGFEIEKFRLAHGSFPKTLDELPQNIVGPWKKDRFSGGSINYRTTDNGYYLYSKGSNQKDETLDTNGQPIKRESDQRGDDVVIAVEMKNNK